MFNLQYHWMQTYPNYACTFDINGIQIILRGPSPLRKWNFWQNVLSAVIFNWPSSHLFDSWRLKVSTLFVTCTSQLSKLLILQKEQTICSQLNSAFHNGFKHEKTPKKHLVEIKHLSQLCNSHMQITKILMYF